MEEKRLHDFIYMKNLLKVRYIETEWNGGYQKWKGEEMEKSASKSPNLWLDRMNNSKDLINSKSTIVNTLS